MKKPTTTNGKQSSDLPMKKDGDVEMGRKDDSYDEYFVPVNEHRKYMRYVCYLSSQHPSELLIALFFVASYSWFPLYILLIFRTQYKYLLNNCLLQKILILFLDTLITEKEFCK